MSERDVLADRLAALRVAASEAARPPGVAAVRRTVARRDARRTLAGAFVVLLVAVAYVLAGATGREPGPVVPPTMTPTPTATPTPSTVETTTAPPPGTSTAASGRGCGYGSSRGPSILGGDELNVSPGDYWSRCPSARVRVVAATYEWDVGSQRYTRAHVTTIYLTAATPTAPVPTPELDPIASVCGYAFVVTGTDVDLPAALPTSLADDWDMSYWYTHGYGSPAIQQWRTAPGFHQSTICQPAPSGSP